MKNLKSYKNESQFEIYKLLSDSKEFELLNNKFNRFNPFKVLRVDKFEIRHSNVLGWLLDPKENHHLGDMFFRKLIAKAILKEENDSLIAEHNIDILELLESSYIDLDIFREESTGSGRKIDLLAISENKKLVVLIENKYKSGESLGQLDDYLNYVKGKYEEYRIIPIFLSLYGVEPTNKEYLMLDYSDILTILSDFTEVNKEYVSNSILDFIKYYIDVLESELTKDEEDINLASVIYKEHKDAIDLLAICDKRNRNMVQKTCNQHVAEFIRKVDAETINRYYAIYLRYKATIDFIAEIGNSMLKEGFLLFVAKNNIPKEFYNAHVRVPAFVLPNFIHLNEYYGTPTKAYWLNNAFAFWFENTGDNRLKINLELGPIEAEKRIILLENLERKGIRIKSSSKGSDAVFTKIYTATLEIEDWADKNEIFEAMNVLYNEEDLQRIIDIINNLNNDTEDNQNTSKDGKESCSEVVDSIAKKEFLIKDAFLKFAEANNLAEECFNDNSKKPSFILSEFRAFDEKVGIPKWNWWHNNAFAIWFEKLNDGRLKLTIELGPLNYSNRIMLINRLEERGIKIRSKAKEKDACYTKILTEAVPVINWENKMEIYEAMNKLYNLEAFKIVINIIKDIARMV